ncbi:MAG TPA: hypothetical protein VJG32_10505 [Anaerolineae bacterium]|nr:hypothetical protein [Anaerolineae bacterium]
MLWTLGSIALFVIGARLIPSRLSATLRAAPVGQIALEAARFVFYVGLPYAALLTGAFAPRDIGLQGSPAPDLILGWTAEDWARALGHAAALGGLTLAVLAVLAWQIRRGGGSLLAALDIDRISVARAIGNGVYAEAHWSFYRALPMLALALGEARWAALAGLALVAGEALLAGRYTETGAQRLSLFEGLLAGLSATYFVLTGGNLWLAILLQIVVRVGVSRMIATARSDESLHEAPEEIIV